MLLRSASRYTSSLATTKQRLPSSTRGTWAPFSTRGAVDGRANLTATMAGLYITSTVDNYPASFQQLLTAPAPHFVFFNADPDPATGQPWCPDCVRTHDAVKATIAAAAGSLLEVQVGPKPVWKSPDHPFRKDPKLKLTGIPTVLHVSGSGEEVARLGKDLEATHSPDEATALMQEFVSAAKQAAA